MEKDKVKTIVPLIGITLLVASLTQVSYCTGGCGSSLAAFLFGWMGMLMELGEIANAVMAKFAGKNALIEHGIGATFCWLANPLLIASFFTIRHNLKTTVILSTACTCIILSFLLFNTVIDNEAGMYNEIRSYGAGYWLWLASSVFMLCSAVYFWRRHLQECSPL